VLGLTLGALFSWRSGIVRFLWCSLWPASDSVLWQNICDITTFVCSLSILGVSVSVTRMTFLGTAYSIVAVTMTVSVLFTMRMSSTAVTVTVIVEEEKSSNVRGQAKASDDQNELWLGDFLWFDKTLNSFEENGHAKRDKEDTVD